MQLHFEHRYSRRQAHKESAPSWPINPNQSKLQLQTCGHMWDMDLLESVDRYVARFFVLFYSWAFD